jgi:protease-4
MLGTLAFRSLTGVVDHTQRSLTGVNALWLGEARF